jgi:hypothetical protein
MSKTKQEPKVRYGDQMVDLNEPFWKRVESSRDLVKQIPAQKKSSPEESRSTASVCHLFLKPMHGAPMRPVQLATAISGEGLQGDASRGRRKRQVLVIELETLRDFELNPGDVRENIVVEGLPLAGTAPGTRLKVGHVEFEVTGDCAPCNLIESLRPGMEQRIKGHRGTLCRVVTGGVINQGDPVALIEKPRD